MALSGSITTNDYLNRYYVLTWSAVQSVEKNQSTISWKVSCAGRSGEWFAERTLKVVLAGRTLVSKTDRVQRYDGNIASGSFAVDHDSNGYLAISGSMQVAVYTSSVNCTGSGSWVLDSIARKANILVAEDFTDEDNPTITYNNPAGNNVSGLQACISLDGSNDDIAYRDIEINRTSYTFELTDSERDVLLSNTLDGKNSRDVVFYIKTVISGNTFYSTLKKTFTVINNKPTLSPTIKDVNPVTLAITNNADLFIRYFSNAQIEIGAKAYKKASIVSESAVCGSGNIIGDSGVIKNVDSANFVFSALDNRGNNVTTSKVVSFIEYTKATCNLTANPSDAEGKLKFSVSGVFYNNVFGTKSNALTLEYCYSENDGAYTEWKTLSYTTNGNKYSASKTIEGLDYRNKYTIKVRAKDLLSEAISTSKALKTTPIFDWGEEDFSFNVKAILKKALELHGNLYMDNSQAIYGKDADGNNMSLVETNGNNHSAFGYGGYDKGEGSSDFYGNKIRVFSNDDIQITSPTAGLTARQYGVNKVLWSSGGWFMNASQNIQLSEPISAQPNGIVLVWSLYDFTGNAGAYDYGLVQHFVPKYMATDLPGVGSYFTLAINNFDYICSKCLYIYDEKIVGHDGNAVNSKSSYSGITYTNKAWVLRYVIGV